MFQTFSYFWFLLGGVGIINGIIIWITNRDRFTGEELNKLLKFCIQYASTIAVISFLLGVLQLLSVSKENIFLTAVNLSDPYNFFANLILVTVSFFFLLYFLFGRGAQLFIKYRVVSTNSLRRGNIKSSLVIKFIVISIFFFFIFNFIIRL